ncbi:hypothetical protein DEO72_LG10g4165 [Vigna unguiculata]|uniref:Uncharacterized protein n=1 Tax=Vigna unguiculata TaxID=3917 RepID=A0A4D6NJR2_VIGUN|nr:hypothetical protein DEO72_LG10g4165 [Vigna unguiculata]
MGSYRTFDAQPRSTAALERTKELKTKGTRDTGRLILNPDCENTREKQKGNSDDLEGYLRGVETDSELAREAWGGTLAERPVSARGRNDWFSESESKMFN